MIILNSERAIREAYSKRGEEFSKLKKSGFSDAIGIRDQGLFGTNYNAESRAEKIFAITAFKNFGFGSAKSETKIQRALEKLSAALLEKNGQPFEPKDLIKQYSASLVFAIFFNEDRPLNDPKFSKISTMTTEWISGLIDGFSLYDSLLPENQLIRNLMCGKALKNGRKTTSNLIDELKEMIQEHRINFDSTLIKDVIDYYIANKGDQDDEDMAHSLLLILPDGVIIASLIMSWMIMYITKHQHVQRKLQEEIDARIGQNQMPTLSDKADLPYAEAIVLETLRCSDTVAMTRERQLKQDTEFMGYTIPKEAAVMASLQSAHYDPVIFPDPSRFDPSRFLDSEGNFNQEQARHVIIFGMGPRMCIGELHIKVQLFLTLVHLAQKFTMTFDPTEPEPSCQSVIRTSFGAFPVPHKVCFTAR